MEDDLNYFQKCKNSIFWEWNTTSIVLKMEDYLNFMKMEDDLIFIKSTWNCCDIRVN